MSETTMLIPYLYGFKKPEPCATEEKRLEALRLLYNKVLNRKWKIMGHLTYKYYQYEENVYKVMIYEDMPDRNGHIYSLPIFLTPPVK